MKKARFEDLYYTAPGGKRKLKRYVVAVLIISVRWWRRSYGWSLKNTNKGAHGVCPYHNCNINKCTSQYGYYANLYADPCSNTCPTDSSKWSLKVDLSKNQYVPIDLLASMTG